MSASKRIQALRNPAIVEYVFRYFTNELANSADLREDLVDHLVDEGYSDNIAERHLAALETHYYGQHPHPSHTFRGLEEPLVSISTAHITQADAELLEELVSEPHLRAFPGTLVNYNGYGWMLRLEDEETYGENVKAMSEAGFSSAFIYLIGVLDQNGFNRVLLDCDAPQHPEFQTFDW